MSIELTEHDEHSSRASQKTKKSKNVESQKLFVNIYRFWVTKKNFRSLASSDLLDQDTYILRKNGPNPWFSPIIDRNLSSNYPSPMLCPIFWLVKLNDLTFGMWHGYMTCDMDTWHVTWVHDLWHGYITFDRKVRLFK